MLADQIIENQSFKVYGDRARVGVRMPWYRALPLSSVAGVEWTVDGIPVCGVTWNGLALDELPPRHDEWWYVLDSAVLEGTVSPAPRDLHRVEVTLHLYIPYITTDFGVLKISDRDVKEVPGR